MYDVWSILTESRARRRCLEIADIRDGESVLEVAVGTGMLFEKILQSNPSGINEGIDLTQEMLDRAGRRLHKSGSSAYVLKTGDAYHLEYPDDSFDIILNNYMFDLLPERDFAVILGGFKRVLRPGGRIVLVNMTKGSAIFNVVWGWLYKFQPVLLGGCRGVELTDYLKEAGFEKVHREHVSQFFFPSEIIGAMKPLT